MLDSKTKCCDTKTISSMLFSQEAARFLPVIILTTASVYLFNALRTIANAAEADGCGINANDVHRAMNTASLMIGAAGWLSGIMLEVIGIKKIIPHVSQYETSWRTKLSVGAFVVAVGALVGGVETANLPAYKIWSVACAVVSGIGSYVWGSAQLLDADLAASGKLARRAVAPGVDMPSMPAGGGYQPLASGEAATVSLAMTPSAPGARA